MCVRCVGFQAADPSSMRSILSNPTGHPFALLPLKGAQHKDRPHSHLPLAGLSNIFTLTRPKQTAQGQAHVAGMSSNKKVNSGSHHTHVSDTKRRKGRSKNKQILDYKIQQQATNSLETKEKKLFDIMQNEKICEFNKLTLSVSSPILPLFLSSLLLCCSCGMRQHVIWPIAVDLALKRISLNVAAGKDGDAALNVLVALQ